VTLPKGKAASIRWLPLNVEVFNIHCFTTMSLIAVLTTQTNPRSGSTPRQTD